jgi:hypothetical protein
MVVAMGTSLTSPLAAMQKSSSRRRIAKSTSPPAPHFCERGRVRHFPTFSVPAAQKFQGAHRPSCPRFGGASVQLPPAISRRQMPPELHRPTCGWASVYQRCLRWATVYQRPACGGRQCISALPAVGVSVPAADVSVPAASLRRA